MDGLFSMGSSFCLWLLLGGWSFLGNRSGNAVFYENRSDAGLFFMVSDELICKILRELLKLRSLIDAISVGLDVALKHDTFINLKAAENSTERYESCADPSGGE